MGWTDLLYRSDSHPGRRVLLAAALFLSLFLGTAACFGAVPDSVLQITASVQSAPPSITLHWLPKSAAASYEVCRKSADAANWGGPVALLDGSATAYTDLLVQTGVKYEYRVSAGSGTIRGYVCSGIALPETPQENRGKVVLVVEQRYYADLLPKLKRLQADLVGDGWQVVFATDANGNPYFPRNNDALDYNDSWATSTPRGPLPQPLAENKASVDAVKKAIQKVYYPNWPSRAVVDAQVKAVLLIGHLPIPYSGNLNPDGHGFRALPADVYYGDMSGDADNGAWRDTRELPNDWYGPEYNVVGSDYPSMWNEFQELNGKRDASGNLIYSQWGSFINGNTKYHYSGVRNHNHMGDGHFDEDTVPAVGAGPYPVELEVGRIDLSNLPAFADSATYAPGNADIRDELDLLRQYLDKDHSFRHGVTTCQRRALLLDPQLARGEWEAYSALFGPDQIKEIAAYRPSDLYSSSYLWASGHTTGTPFSTALGFTWDYARNDAQAVFTTQYGSFSVDWGHENSVLRGILGGKNYTLTSFWDGGNAHFYQMGMGETIGQCVRRTQCNPAGMYGDYSAPVYTALMGDPTLRMHIVAPAQEFAVSRSSENDPVLLKWTQPDGVLGFNVYRAESPSGPFTRINDEMVPVQPGQAAGISFADPAPPSTEETYMVRSLKLEETPSGSYYNLSEGVMAKCELKVAAPVFSPDGVATSDPQVVTITCNPSAVIHYTTDSSEPTENDPTIASGGTVDVDAGKTLKARAWRTGWTASNVKAARYAPKVATPTFSLAGGTYNSVQLVTISCGTPGATIQYTTSLSEVWVQGNIVKLYRSAQLRAVATKEGWDSSGEALVSYTFPRFPLRVKSGAQGDNDGASWDDAFPDIDSALDTAKSGDQIWVAAGTYKPPAEGLQVGCGIELYGGFDTQDASLVDRDWVANQTIIDGSGCDASAPTISIGGSGSPGARVDGFTITGNPFQGVYCGPYTTPTITHNVIQYNGQSRTDGVGINCGESSAPVISFNTIDHNGQSAWNGGGIRCYWVSAPVITNNTIAHNGPSLRGGGIYCSALSAPVIAGNLIADNSVAARAADSQGGGICCRSASATITNNTLVGNTALGDGIYKGRGGAIYCEGGSTRVYNNILAFNSSGLSRGVSPATTVTEDYNCYHNVADDLANISMGLNSRAADPLLTADYHLRPASPCIDAGLNSAPYLPSIDIDAEVRPCTKANQVDIGADEFYSQTIADGKRLMDGARVTCVSNVITFARQDYFYMECDNRASGILVMKSSHGLSVGDRVDVAGTVRTADNGERCIEADWLSSDGRGTITPLVMNNRNLGGGSFHYGSKTGAGQQGITGASGWNNIGLLVRTCGKVTSVGADSFTVDDGSGVDPKVVAHAEMSLPALNDHVMVTGISSCEKAVGSLSRTIIATQVDAGVVGSTVSFHLAGGWSTIAAPLVPFEPDPPTVLGYTSVDLRGRLSRTDHGNGVAYDDSGPADFGNILFGDGYWLYVGDDGGHTVSYSGYPDGLADPAGGALTDAAVSLPGNLSSTGGCWHIFGQPFNHDTMATDILFTNGIEVKSWADAYAAGWVSNRADGLDTASKNGGFGVSFNPLIRQDARFRAHDGYQIRTYVPDLAMIIPASPAIPSGLQSSSLSVAKTLDDDAWVELDGVQVSAVFRDFFYLEVKDTTNGLLSGMRVEKKGHGLSAGHRVSIVGKMKTNTNGERYIEPSSVQNYASASPPKPLMLNNKTLGGGDLNYNSTTGAGQQGITGAVGWNNIGLLIRTCGKVTSVSADSFAVDDGSGANPKVVVSGSMAVPELDDHVMVTGVSSCEKPSGRLNPVILATKVDTKVTSTEVSYALSGFGNRVSAPLVPFDPHPLSVFGNLTSGIDGLLRRRDVASSNWVYYYDSYPTAFGSVLLGDGYYLTAYPPPQTVTYYGYPDGLADPVTGELTDAVISLPGNPTTNAGGLHSIGQPFNHDTLVDSGNALGDLVFFTDGVTVKNWSSASAAGWCDVYMSGIDNALFQSLFQLRYDGVGNSDKRLRAGHGYYIRTYVPSLALIIPSARAE